MKYSRSDVRGKAYAIPRLRFETPSLTSFAGRVLRQRPRLPRRPRPPALCPGVDWAGVGKGMM